MLPQAQSHRSGLYWSVFTVFVTLVIIDWLSKNVVKQLQNVGGVTEWQSSTQAGTEMLLQPDTFYKEQVNVLHLMLTLQLGADDLDIAAGALEGLLSFLALTIFNMSLGVAAMSWHCSVLFSNTCWLPEQIRVWAQEPEHIVPQWTKDCHPLLLWLLLVISEDVSRAGGLSVWTNAGSHCW